MNLSNNPSDNILTVNELLTIEDDPDLLRYRFSFDDILMWPYIRHRFLLSAQIPSLKFAIPPQKLRLLPRIVFPYIYHSIAHNPYSGAKTQDIIFFSSGVVNIRNSVSSCYENRLYDHFAGEYPEQTMLIEDSDQFQYHRPRNYRSVKYHDLIDIISWFVCNSTPTPSRDQQTIHAFVAYLQKAFTYPLPPGTWDMLRAKLHTAAKRLAFLHQAYAFLFKRLCPKVLFIEGGCYGMRSHIIKWAKELGIATAEVQHGLISKNHIDYNYSPAIIKNGYRSYLPDYFLVNGKYWANTVSLPADMVIIGNPYITETVRAMQSPENKHPHSSVLFISGGYQPNVVCNLVLGFYQHSGPTFTCRLRPHPMERSVADTRYRSLLDRGIALENGNLYHAMSQADYIVALEASTVLFEALAIGKKVFVLNRPEVSYYLDEPVFATFNDAEDLVEKLASGNSMSVDPDYFFHPDWKNAYRGFIDRVVYHKNAATATSRRS
jgi:hypothetical protein